MKKLLLLILSLSLTGGQCMSQSLAWEHLFPVNRYFGTLQKTIDGNLITSGGKPLNGNTGTTTIVKYDLEGNQIWQSAGRISSIGEHDLKQSSDGKYLFAGNMFRSQPGNYSDTYLLQLDENGDTSVTWSQTYIDQGWDYPTEMVLLDSGDIMIAGLHLAPAYYTLRRTDSLGNTKWYKKYADYQATYGTRMIRNRNGNLVLLGMVITPTVYPFHPYLIEVSTSGDSLRSNLLVLADSSELEETNRVFNNIIQTSDGGYAFGGKFEKNGYIAKTDSLFNLLWYYEFPPQLQMQGVENRTSKLMELQDSTLLLLSKDAASGVTEFYITRLSKDGDSLSTTSIQSPLCPDMLPYQWQFLADSSVVICGVCVTNQQAYISRWGSLNFPLPMDFFTDTGTVSVPEVLTHHKPSLGQSYPNPTTKTATIPYTLPKGVQSASIELRDLVTGRIISRYSLPTNEGAAELPVTLSNIAAGVYVYTLTINGNPAGTKKMVLTR